jgi:hypothetical protein
MGISKHQKFNEGASLAEKQHPVTTMTGRIKDSMIIIESHGLGTRKPGCRSL